MPGLPKTATITFSTSWWQSHVSNASTANGLWILNGLTRHEMGHALGLGSRWAAASLISGSVYTGVHAVAQHSGLAIPLADGAHWSETDFQYDVMSLDANPDLLDVNGNVTQNGTVISAMTIGSLKDLGYQVDPNAHD